MFCRCVGCYVGVKGISWNLGGAPARGTRKKEEREERERRLVLLSLSNHSLYRSLSLSRSLSSRRGRAMKCPFYKETEGGQVNVIVSGSVRGGGWGQVKNQKKTEERKRKTCEETGKRLISSKAGKEKKGTRTEGTSLPSSPLLSFPSFFKPSAPRRRQSQSPLPWPREAAARRRPH